MSKAKEILNLFEEAIDKAKVKEAAMNAAKDIFKEPDEKIINSMIDKVISDGKAETTKDAIQIVISMMRSKG